VDRGFLNAAYLEQHDPFLAPLRTDPRFRAIVARARRGAVHTNEALAALSDVTPRDHIRSLPARRPT
jgi:hypothetical protein